MGEVKKATCTTVAVRYRFVVVENELRFEPEPLRKIEIEDESSENADVEEDSTDTEDDVEFLRSLDPKQWKDQDHYAVLGIKNLRINATDDDIRRAYRKKVLKHHPDKRKAQGEEIRQDDDYFTCITKAYEILGTPIKRRSYDSVDPYFDDALPAGTELKMDFFNVFPKYFEMNARWSEKKPVPLPGDADTKREEVEKFYSFWYNFDSWREYSYLDEEEKEKGQDRDERRWIEKQNKAARAKRKKEEMSRIRQLVDLAYNADPRIAKFKQEDKDRKLAAKRAKQSAAQARKEEEERLMREEREAKEKEEAEERARQEAKKLERETQKKALKKERKTFRDICKANNYFCTTAEENLTHLTAIEKICEAFKVEELEKVNNDLKTNGRDAFLTAMREIDRRLEEERKAVFESKKKLEDKEKMTLEWTEEHIQMLIKGVNLFPAGTNQRWEVVANFINQHGSTERNFTAKEVLAKAKDLQNTDFSKSNLKMAANKQAYDNFEKEKRSIKTVDDSEISKKMESLSVKNDANKMNGQQEAPKAEVPWTPNEQQLLEQALKTYPTTTDDRWGKIAECVPNRSKKDCMKRYKELVEIVKAKKAAQASLKK